MDFAVEATVPLTSFQDQAAVHDLLTRHDFSIIDRTRSLRLRIRGSFLELKAVKDSLEQLVDSENQTVSSPRWSSKLQSPSSEEILRVYSNPSSTSGGTRGRTGSRSSSCSSPSDASESPVSNTHSHKHSSSSDPTGSSPPGGGPKDSCRPRSEFLVDTDVYKYVALVREEKLVKIQQKHKVKMVVQDIGDSSRIILQGKNATKAEGEVNNLLKDLSRSLCTQDVLLKDLSPQGRELLSRIQKSKNVYRSVLVEENGDGLHLIGSPQESYDLKQKLLVVTVEKKSRGWTSLKKHHQNAEKNSGATAATPPTASVWYDKDAEREGEAEGDLRRSRRASRGKTGEDKSTNFVQKTNIKPTTPTGP